MMQGEYEREEEKYRHRRGGRETVVRKPVSVSELH